MSSNCLNCNQKGNPWIVFQNKGLRTDEDGNNIGKNVYCCSYLCSKNYRPGLPKNYGQLIVNREDFCWIMPVMNQREKEFEHLTLQEIQQLSDSERETYYESRDNHIALDSNKQELYRELEEQEYNTMLLEEDSSTSESEYDDY